MLQPYSFRWKLDSMGKQVPDMPILTATDMSGYKPHLKFAVHAEQHHTFATQLDTSQSQSTVKEYGA